MATNLNNEQNNIEQMSWEEIISATIPQKTTPKKTPALPKTQGFTQTTLKTNQEIALPAATKNSPTPPPITTEQPVAKTSEPKIISVSDLNKHIRDLLEGKFTLVWLKGEISNFKAHTSGHFYFSLKDAKAQINAVMFKGFNQHLRFRPSDGMEVLVRGKITVYEPRGNYQIFCEVLEPIGAGALQKAFEQLKAKLQAEGLFAQEKKRALPQLPQHIAIVTSPTGAAIRDMLNVLRRRYKGARITIIPCKVQGDQAPGEIVEAIQMANKLNDVDVMIVGRGGGSIEDLWAFNDERVARAIASARVPIISAVGHEIDFTIADFVADLRAPTPSAAAELVVKNAAELVEKINATEKRLKISWSKFLQFNRQKFMLIKNKLIDPARKLQDAALKCDELLQRLTLAQNHRFERLSLRLAKTVAVMDSLSPLKVLDRGYSLVMKDEQIIRSVAQINENDLLKIKLSKGSLETKVVSKILEA